jgi:uncharacterized protein
LSRNRNCSPYAGDTNPHFDLYAELVRFFDAHLKDNKADTGVTTEPAIHYYNIGAERWLTSVDQWPPADVR